MCQWKWLLPSTLRWNVSYHIWMLAIFWTKSLGMVDVDIMEVFKIINGHQFIWRIISQGLDNIGLDISNLLLCGDWIGSIWTYIFQQSYNLSNLAQMLWPNFEGYIGYRNGIENSWLKICIILKQLLNLMVYLSLTKTLAIKPNLVPIII